MTLAVAFIAGLVSILSPCVLPVIPVYAGYVTGGAGDGWSSGYATGSVRRTLAGRAIARRSIGEASWRAIGFLLGFLGVFVLLWASVGVVGFTLMSAVPFLRQVTGGLIVGMGLLMIAGRNPMLRLPSRLATVGAGGPLLLGAGVAVGWTPCIGPTLGAILGLAAAAPTVGSGLALLLAYAAGLAIPFLAVLVALRRFRRLVGWLAERRRAINVVTGIMVVGVGVLVFSGAFARLAGLFNIGVI